MAAAAFLLSLPASGATRFYLPSTGAPAITPAFDAVWEDSSSGSGNGPIRRKAVTIKISSAMTTDSFDDASATTPLDVVGFQYTTDPICAQTISGTVKGQMRASQGLSASDFMRASRIRVVDSGGATRCILADDFASGLTSEFAGSLTNRNFPPSRSVTPCATTEGDYIVMELGARAFNTDSTSRTYNVRHGDASASDLPEDETTVTDDNPWVEFSQTITFSGGGCAVDTTAPSAVSNLADDTPTTTSCRLTWTSPGDDAGAGTATSYDIRRATIDITNDTEFNAATTLTGEPTPLIAGSAQNYTATGLSASTTYFFAMKTSDEVPNVSALSNSTSCTTSAADTTAPSAVSNLAAGSPTSSCITLTWTSPGDDANTGQAASYDVRYRTGSAIGDDTAFNGATQATGEPAPKVAGNSESFQVCGLAASTTYHFALKTADEVPNTSTLSNSPNATTSAAAAGNTYYFSDCVSGGSGTSGDPWCIDPPDAVACAASGDVWIASMTDGCGTEITAADDIIICCGGCGAAGQTCDDAAHVGEVGVVASGNDVLGDPTWFMPRVSGTSGNRITVTPFCTGGVCDTVIITGDHDGDGVFDVGEPQRFMGVPTASHYTIGYWTFDGNPLVSSGSWNQAKYMTWTRANGRMIRNDSDGSNGWGNMIWEDMEISRTDDLVWADPHFADAVGCPGGQAFTFFIARVSGDMTWRRNRFFLACQTVFRLNNAFGAFTFTVEDNEFYNVGSSFDANQFGGGSLMTWSVQRNYLHDVSLTSWDIGLTNATIADNLITCEGVHKVESNWSCRRPLNVGDDNCDDCIDCHDIIIARNKIYGKGESGGANGWWQSGITICSNLVTSGDPNVVIENNMLWHIKQSDNDIDCALAGTSSGGAGAITINTNDVVTVRNNTIYDSTNGITLSDANHIAKNNIVVRSSTMEWNECGDVSSANQAFNNVHDTSGNVICENDTSVTANCDGTTYTCATAGTFGSNNKCAAPRFETCDSATYCVNIAADEASWNLRLASTDTADIDAGTTGATTDIDGTTRPQGAATDIGAHEFLSGGPVADTTPPSTITNLSAAATSDVSCTLTWTAPGDDGAAGTATSYDIRRASTSIDDDTEFGAATAIVGEPSPTSGGLAEQFVVTGLTASTLYHFAMKTSDEVPNTSLLSNDTFCTTFPPPDSTPPADVAGLTPAQSFPQPYLVIIAWIATGDDGNTGTAASYDLRYSLSSIDDLTEFSTATSVVGEPTPDPPGTSEQVQVILTQGTQPITYFFRLRVADEAGNVSGMSPQVQVVVPAQALAAPGATWKSRGASCSDAPWCS